MKSSAVRPLAERTDGELFEAFRNGEARAFEHLLDRYERAVYNFVLRSVREPDRATDLTQEVFLRLVQRADQFQGKSKFSTWMFTVARNLCVDHSRKMVFRRHRSLDAPGDRDRSPLVERVATAEETDRAATGRALQRDIASAVEALPDDQREVFLLREVQGLPFREIAVIVRAPENTVKSRMRYALERLQTTLDKYRDYVKTLK